MKRYQSGSEKRKKFKRKEEVAKQQNSIFKYMDLQTAHPSMSSTRTNIEEISDQKRKINEEVKAENENTCLTDLKMNNIGPVYENIYEVKNNYEETDTAKEMDLKGDETNINTEIFTTEIIEICHTVNQKKNDIIEDIALWPDILTQGMIDYFVFNKPKNIGDIKQLKSLYKDRDRTYRRSLQEGHFYRIKTNGVKEKRDWLVFSETSRSIYCYVCKMFSRSVKSKLISGFQNWKTISAVLNDHEISNDHMSSMSTLFLRSSKMNRIDSDLLQQMEIQKNYWREVLRRVISTIKLIASMGLAFRGHEESKNSERKGNFLTCLNYLSEYDEFLKMHLEKYAYHGQGTSNYLSHQTCDEFISIIHAYVRTQIVDEIKLAGYYSIILDSTSDISHEDQLSFIMRYISPNGEMKERFLCFLQIERHDAGYLEEQVLKTLTGLDIDITRCRGQTYDNASNMAGKYSGLQARLKKYSPSAFFVPCISHSLNLIGNSVADSTSTAIDYFQFIQDLFLFFSASNGRWNILQKKLDEVSILILKKLSDTRWSARADAVLAQ